MIIGILEFVIEFRKIHAGIVQTSGEFSSKAVAVADRPMTAVEFLQITSPIRQLRDIAHEGSAWLGACELEDPRVAAMAREHLLALQILEAAAAGLLLDLEREPVIRSSGPQLERLDVAMEAWAGLDTSALRSPPGQA